MEAEVAVLASETVDPFGWRKVSEAVDWRLNADDLLLSEEWLDGACDCTVSKNK